MDSLKTDCRHFHSDRPCAPHKAHGVVCATCTEHYDPVATRILIVKLAAIGDVLRTTSFLPAIHRRWPKAHITWVTSPAAAPMFAANPLVDRVISFHGHMPVEIVAERFDVILNPDAAADACAIAHSARGLSRVGFDLDERTGLASPLSDAASAWFEMGVRDDLKKANRRTYQSLVAEVLGLDYQRERPSLELDDAGTERSRALRAEHGGRGRIIGLNTGAGGRWTYKKWTEAGYTGLIERLVAAGDTVFLLGGPEEVERNAELAARGGSAVIDTGCHNTLLEFGGIVDACDAVVTGDTLAMHVALARNKPTIVLFGPTSLHEIDVFDKGERIAPEEMSCLCCYLSNCDVRPTCMDNISVDRVEAAVMRALEVAPS